jgi:hypothetical protein
MFSRVPFFLIVSAVMALAVSPARSNAARLGLELEGRSSTVEHTQNVRSGEKIDSRFLPGFGLTLQQAMGSRFQAGPSLRYTERGEKTSWNDPPWFGGSESVLERTLSSGLSVRWDVVRRLFLRANPELSYLVSGRAEGAMWFAGVTRPYDNRYEKVSDRWNAIADVGVGTGWSLGGRPGTVEVRYMTEVNTMTRNVNTNLWRPQPNIAWTNTPAPIPYYTSEYRSRAVELVMGYSW